MVSLSEREEFRSTCSVISASTMSVLAGAAGLPPKSTSITRPPAFGGVSTLTASPIQRAAGSAKSRSQSTRSTTRLPPRAARRALAHQLVVGPRGARRRVALAPGGDDENELLGRGERREIEVHHVDDIRLEAVLARRLGNVAGELFRIPGLARIHNGQWFRRSRRRSRLCLLAGCGFNARQKARKPCALNRVGRPNHAVEQRDVLLGEGRGLWDVGKTGRHSLTSVGQPGLDGDDDSKREDRNANFADGPDDERIKPLLAHGAEIGGEPDARKRQQEGP